MGFMENSSSMVSKSRGPLRIQEGMPSFRAWRCGANRRWLPNFLEGLVQIGYTGCMSGTQWTTLKLNPNPEAEPTAQIRLERRRPRRPRPRIPRIEYSVICLGLLDAAHNRNKSINPFRTRIQHGRTHMAGRRRLLFLISCWDDNKPYDDSLRALFLSSRAVRII